MLRYALLSVTCWAILASGCYQDAPEPSTQVTMHLLLSRLNDPDESIRRTAAESLGKIGRHEAVAALIPLLRDQAPAVRSAAARSLGQLPPIEQATIQATAELIQDPDSQVRRAAVDTLGNLEDIRLLLPRLIELARHSDPAVRQAAVQILLLTGGSGAIDAVLVRTTDVHPAVRQTAVAALGEFDGDRARPVLRDRLLDDADPGVRAEAAYRLHVAGDDSMLADLDRAAIEDASPAVRRWAQWSADTIRRGRDSGSARPPAQPAPPVRSRQSL